MHNAEPETGSARALCARVTWVRGLAQKRPKYACFRTRRRRPASGVLSHAVSVDGVCTKMMSRLKEGKRETGMSVTAVFNTENPTNTMVDLGWVPA